MNPALLLCGLLLASPALAEGPRWSFQASQRVQPGVKAEIALQSANTAHGVKLVLVPVSGGGAQQTFSVKRLKAGARKVFRFNVPPGASVWRGELTGAAEGTTSTAILDLKVVSARALDVQVSKADVDLAAGRVVVRPTNPLDKVEVQAWDAEGGQFIDDQGRVSVQGAVTHVNFDVPADTNVRRVELKLFDAYGFWAALRIVRWYDEVAHDRVEFDSAKWDIRPEQAPKLDAAIVALGQAIAKFRAELGDAAATVDGAVYVAGYTDTVGGVADNAALSEKRAASIARYFKAKGLSVPVWYAGFGEAVQALSTADEVDAPANRRALFILANSAPTGEAFPNARWRQLK
jgi:outer membrane protein OmpA-like peptidoglycan-associated protein